MWDQWFVEEFTFLGIHFQNWMPVAVATVLVAILAAWLQQRTW
jgi:hypothetical protein